MGADEITSDEVRDISEALAKSVEQKLDHGWSIAILSGGQLLLVPPPNREPSGPKI